MREGENFDRSSELSRLLLQPMQELTAHGGIVIDLLFGVVSIRGSWIVGKVHLVQDGNDERSFALGGRCLVVGLGLEVTDILRGVVLGDLEIVARKRRDNDLMLFVVDGGIEDDELCACLESLRSVAGLNVLGCD